MSASFLKVAASARTPCDPWDLRGVREEHPRGGVCADCGRDIAVFGEQIGYETVCVYCALADGTLPLEEIEPWEERSLHQIAMAERAA